MITFHGVNVIIIIYAHVCILYIIFLLHICEGVGQLMDVLRNIMCAQAPSRKKTYAETGTIMAIYVVNITYF